MNIFILGKGDEERIINQQVEVPLITEKYLCSLFQGFVCSYWERNEENY